MEEVVEIHVISLKSLEGTDHALNLSLGFFHNIKLSCKENHFMLILYHGILSFASKMLRFVARIISSTLSLKKDRATILSEIS